MHIDYDFSKFLIFFQHTRAFFDQLDLSNDDDTVDKDASKSGDITDTKSQVATKAKFTLKIGKRQDQEAPEEETKQLRREQKAEQKLMKQEQKLAKQEQKLAKQEQKEEQKLKKEEQKKEEEAAEDQNWPDDEKSEYEKIMVCTFY